MWDQRPYWERVANEKSFTHPINLSWLESFAPKESRILDYGCGYGRTLSELDGLGYSNLVGVDFSAAMVARGLRRHPNLDLRVLDAIPMPEPDDSFDVVLLFAVLTSVPDEGEQDALMGEVRRVLRPGGLLYFSDMPLQSDERNLARYDRDAAEFRSYGVFRTDDGAVVRHHHEDRLRSLTGGFDVLRAADLELSTMNAHAATALQLLARRL